MTGTFADLLTTKTSYDLEGRRESETDVLGQTTLYGYNDAGQLTSVTLPEAYAFDGTNGSMHPSLYQYGFDTEGNQTSITDPKLGQTTFTYDHRGRQLTRTLPLGQSSPAFTETMVYNDQPLSAIDQSTIASSVGLGQLEYQVSFEGVVTAFKYDNGPQGGGRLVETSYFENEDDYLTGEDAVERVTYQYDAFGRQIESAFYRVGSETPDTTSYIFDADGRQTTVSSPEGVINYDYDPAGRLTRTYTASGATDTHYHYDELGRMVSVGSEDPTSVSNTQYYFDQVGNLDAVRLPEVNGESVTTDYQYDSLHRLTKVDQFIDKNNNNTFDGSDSQIQSFTYDVRVDGKRTGVTEERSGGSTNRIDWVYDQMGRLAAEAYDADGTAEDYIAVYRFDRNGNRTAKLVDESISDSEFNSFRNGIGIDALLSGGDLPDFTAGKTTIYEFDANDRLRKEVFDDLDNSQDTTTLYGYVHENLGPGTQITSKQTYSGHSTPNTTNLTESVTYGYNLQGRQDYIDVDAELPQDDVTTSYKFNANGVRVGQTVNDTPTTFLVDENNPTGYAQVLEQGDAGSDGELDAPDVALSYTLGHDVIAQTDTQAGEIQYLLYDGHGSTRALVDGDGMVVVNPAGVPQIFDYDAYGNLLNMTADQAATSLLYSGEFTDAATGQQYLRARFYDPSTGRFNRLDPFAGSESAPLTLHKYVYAHGDPIQGHDPTGLFTVVGASIGSGLLGSLAGLQSTAYAPIVGGIAGRAGLLGLDQGFVLRQIDGLVDKYFEWLFFGTTKSFVLPPLPISPLLQLTFGGGVDADPIHGFVDGGQGRRGGLVRVFGFGGVHAIGTVRPGAQPPFKDFTRPISLRALGNAWRRGKPGLAFRVPFRHGIQRTEFGDALSGEICVAGSFGYSLLRAGGKYCWSLSDNTQRYEAGLGVGIGTGITIEIAGLLKIPYE